MGQKKIKSKKEKDGNKKNIVVTMAGRKGSGDGV